MHTSSARSVTSTLKKPAGSAAPMSRLVTFRVTPCSISALHQAFKVSGKPHQNWQLRSLRRYIDSCKV